MLILVHIKDQVLQIQCGQGRQRIQWLADSAIHRLDANYGFSLGPISHIRLADETVLNSNSAIADALSDSAEIWVVLKGTFYIDETSDPVRGEETKSPKRGKPSRTTARSKK